MLRKKKVCKKCGCINDCDYMFCENCQSSLEDGIIIEVEHDNNSFFYDYKNDKFCNENPFQEKPKPIVKEERFIKCNTCGAIFSDKKRECPDCGMVVFNDTPSYTKQELEALEKKKEEEKASSKEVKVEEEKPTSPMTMESYEDSNQYVLIFADGKSSQIDITFKDGIFPIGRLHQGNILYPFQSVSRNHCFIKKTKDNRYFLCEDDNYHGSYGTYYVSIGNVKKAVTKNNYHELENGDRFYISDLQVEFTKKL